jgi:hypothetical protein
VVGWVADRFGPRWSLGMGAASGFAAAVVGIYYLAKYRHARLRLHGRRLRFSIDGETALGPHQPSAGAAE